MKILLLGREGQVGWELQRSLAPLGTLLALGREARHNPDGLCGDLTQSPALLQTLQRIQPDVIVNAAAYTAVDRAESEADLAHAVNAAGPALLADFAQQSGAWLLHYSTDYVFDGSGTRPWHETDATAPQNVYGRTKLAGEQAVARCARHLVLRTSWVYGARGGNFARTILRLAGQRETLQVIDDQHGAPTGADLIADVSAHALRQVMRQGAPTQAGIYHLVAAGETTWNAYARYVLALAGTALPAIKLLATRVEPVSSAAFASAARRPLNSRLATDKLQTTFGLQLPDWKLGVERMLKEMNHETTH
ncbi:MAG: dTDP-4-dehydrorhamnose reductase [Rhodoferax sp.]